VEEPRGQLHKEAQPCARAAPNPSRSAATIDWALARGACIINVSFTGPRDPSIAAAEVSGIVALLLERQPKLGPAGIHKALIATARDLGPKGIDPQFGPVWPMLTRRFCRSGPRRWGRRPGSSPPQPSNGLKLFIFFWGRAGIEHGNERLKNTPETAKIGLNLSATCGD
jgi:Subtilase family